MPPEEPKQDIGNAFVANNINIGTAVFHPLIQPPAPTADPKIPPSSSAGQTPDTRWGLPRKQFIPALALTILALLLMYPVSILFNGPVSSPSHAVLIEEKQQFFENQRFLLGFVVAVLAGYLVQAWRITRPDRWVIAARTRVILLWIIAAFAFLFRQLRLAHDTASGRLDNTAASMSWPLWLGTSCLLAASALLIFCIQRRTL